MANDILQWPKLNDRSLSETILFWIFQYVADVDTHIQNYHQTQRKYSLETHTEIECALTALTFVFVATFRFVKKLHSERRSRVFGNIRTS